MTAKNTLKTTGDRTLIVYAHPYDGSFNHAVLEAATSALDKAGRGQHKKHLKRVARLAVR